MKKLFALVFAIILLSVSFCSLVFAESEGYKGTYVVFGDSIAAGYGLDDSAFGSDESMYYVAGRDSDAYAGIVARELGYDLYNFAQSGATSGDLLQRLKLQSVSDAIKKADLITISIGGNDLIGMTSKVLPIAAMHELAGTPQTTDEIEEMFANLKENLTAAISRIAAQNPSCVIMLQSLYNPFKYNKSYTVSIPILLTGGTISYNVGNLIDYYINRINQIYLEVQDELHGFMICETARALNADERSFYEVTSPDFHPTLHGHKLIAETILAAYEDTQRIDQTTAPDYTTATTIPTTEPTTVTTIPTTEPTTATTVPTTEPTTATTIPTTEPTAEKTVATTIITVPSATEPTAATPKTDLLGCKSAIGAGGAAIICAIILGSAAIIKKKQ